MQVAYKPTFGIKYPVFNVDNNFTSTTRLHKRRNYKNIYGKPPIDSFNAGIFFGGVGYVSRINTRSNKLTPIISQGVVQPVFRKATQTIINEPIITKQPEVVFNAEKRGCGQHSIYPKIQVTKEGNVPGGFTSSENLSSWSSESNIVPRFRLPRLFDDLALAVPSIPLQSTNYIVVFDDSGKYAISANTFKNVINDDGTVELVSGPLVPNQTLQQSNYYVSTLPIPASQNNLTPFLLTQDLSIYKKYKKPLNSGIALTFPDSNKCVESYSLYPKISTSRQADYFSSRNGLI